MPSSQPRKSKMRIIASLLFLVALFVFVLTNIILGNYFLVLVAGIITTLGALYFWSPRNALLIVLILVPTLAGLDSYQIDISFLLKLVNFQEDYTVDIFFLARAFILLLAVIEIMRRGFAVLKTPLSLILLISAILNAISFYYSDYKLQGVAFYWVHLVAAFGAYFLGYFLFATRKRYLKILMAIILSSVIPIIVGIKQIVLREFFFSNDSALPRIQATFWHPNKFGSFLFVVTVVYLIFYLSIKVGKESAKKKLLFFLPFLLFIPLLGFTFSRTSWVALAFAIFVIAIIRRPLRKPAILLGGLLTAVALSMGRIRDRILDIFSWSMNNSVSGRMEIWDIGFFKLSQKPWLGFGPGSFGEVIKDARGSEEGNISAHSDVVRFLIEGGVVGLLAYLLYFVGAIAYAFISFFRYPQSSKRIRFLGKGFLVDFKLLGFIPFLLFLSMIPISFMETSASDFVYQLFAWIALGSWLAVSSKTIKTRKKRRVTQRRKLKEVPAESSS